jgi:hypothetical protein
MPEPDDDKPSITWASTIPEISYDIVARMLPGIVFVAAGVHSYACFRSWILHQPVHWIEFNKEAPIFGLLLAGAIACWIIGLLLTPFGDMLWRGRQRKQVFLNAVAANPTIFLRAQQAGILAQKYGVALWQPDPKQEDLTHRAEVSSAIYQQLHEYLKDRKPEWRGLLSKTQAEVTFYANVSAALLLALAGELIMTAVAAWALPKTPAHLADRLGLAYWAISLLPILLLLAAALIGLKQKQERLWSRQVALLVNDLRDSNPIALPANDNYMA